MNKKDYEQLTKMTRIIFISIQLSLTYNKNGYNMHYFDYDNLELEFKKGHDQFFIFNNSHILPRGTAYDITNENDTYTNLFNELVSGMAKRNYYTITPLEKKKGVIKCNKISRSQAVINEL